MKYFLVLFLALWLPLAAHAKALSTDQKFLLNNVMGPVASQVGLGDLIDSSKSLVRVVYDSTVHDRGSSTVDSGVHALDVALPANSVITRAWYQILNKFATNHAASIGQAQVAFKCESAANIKTAGALNALAVGDITAGVSDDTVANFKAITSACNVTATVTVENFDTGTLALWLEYYVSQ